MDAQSPDHGVTGQEQPPIDRIGLVAAITAIAVAAIAFGQSLPLFSLLLSGYGASDGLIGLNSGTAAIGAIALTPLFPRILSRFGVKPFLLTSLGLLILSYLGLYLAGERIWAWFPLRFFIGAAASALFVTSEVWITALAPAAIRGRIIGIYSTALALGFALGPLLIDVFGTEGFAPFAAGVGVFGAAMIPVLIAKPPPASPEDAAKGFFGLLMRAPATFLAAAIFSAMEAALLTFLPIFAVESGFGEKVGARAVSIYGFGLMSVQYLIGRYADGIGYGRTLLLCAIGASVGAVGFTMTGTNLVAIYGVLFVWGGLLAGLYTTGLTIIAGRFSDQDRAAANTGFVFAYGAGAIAGPSLAGLVRQGGGQDALNLFIVVVLGAYALLVARRQSAGIP